tara:strand:+ start:319 stop:1065 length:747 start_codon:yes stop_codon:yes gene_type:complete
MNNFKFFSLALAATITFSSCSSDDDQGTVVDLNLTAQLSDAYVNPASLPQSILTYISSNYPNNTITEAEVEDNNNYEVELDNGLELVFDHQGNFLGIDDDSNDNFGDEDIAVGDLPENILTFINTHFPGVTIEGAEMENNGNYEVELSDDTELVFDTNGNFLGRADDDDNDDRDDDDIAVSELPQLIRDYIAENYPDNTIIEAEKEDDNSYEVTLNNGIELEFDAEGNFVGAEDQNGEDDDDDDDDEG